MQQQHQEDDKQRQLKIMHKSHLQKELKGKDLNQDKLPFFHIQFKGT